MIDKEKRNIKFEYLDIPQFFINEETKEINESGLIEAIRIISPQIVIMVICYSQILELKFLLEESGLFSEIRLSRDLNILSRGQILKLNNIQTKFIQKMAQEINIEKNVIITGPVGSGKTMLGLETINMKKSHYRKKYGLNVVDIKGLFSVDFGRFVVDCFRYKFRNPFPDFSTFKQKLNSGFVQNSSSMFIPHFEINP